MNLTAFYMVILALFVMLVVGYVARRAKIINDSVSKALSAIVIKIGQPFMIVGAMIGVEFSLERLKDGLLVLALGLVFHAIIAVIAYFAVFKFKAIEERKITEFAMIFGNCGFIGFPLVESVLGKEGLFYAAFFLISFNLFMWTWGIVVLARDRADIKVNPKTMIFNYGTIPCVMGVMVYALQIPVPEFLEMSVSYLGSLCTPISMLITGALIGTVSLKELFCDLKIYYTCFVKLVLGPAVVVILMCVLRFDSFYTLLMAITFAMPTATATVMFAELYEIEKKRAAICAGVCSILSMITMPLIMTVLQNILK